MIIFGRCAVLTLLIAIWALAAAKFGPNVIPTPTATFVAASRLIAEGRLISALSASLSVYLTGYVAAVIVAIPLGVFMGAFSALGKVLDVYAFALAATPRVAFIPLIIVMLGLGSDAKIFIIFLGALMPILINTYSGMLNVDEELVEMAKSVGASKKRIFTSISLPSSVPFIVTGMRLGATIGLINTVVAELYTAVSGLGGLLAIYGNTFRMAEYFVVVITLAVIGVIITETLRYAENRLQHWR